MEGWRKGNRGIDEGAIGHRVVSWGYSSKVKARRLRGGVRAGGQRVRVAELARK